MLIAIIVLVTSIQGVVIPISSMSITFIPMWYIFNLGAEGISTTSLGWRIFGFIFTWLFVSLILNAYFVWSFFSLYAPILTRFSLQDEMLIFPFATVLLSLVLRLLYYVGAVPNCSSARISRRVSRMIQNAQECRLPLQLYPLRNGISYT